MANEKRLIDANALMEEAHWVIRSDGTRVFAIHAEDVDNAPTVDAVEVVRCEDCKHWLKAKELSPFGWCCQRVPDSAYVGYRDRRFPEDFCSKGERKDNGCNDG